LVPGDWDGDGAEEVIAAVRGAGLWCLKGDGSIQWKLSLEDDVVPLSLVDEDLDGDGFKEIFGFKRNSFFQLMKPPRTMWQAKMKGTVLASANYLQGSNGATPRVVQLS